ncbi:MAG: hypothetical protein HZB18_03965 [Chloroflexi bacterium]|nr:hypothetical protein [Chloroflexota bacterium]
MRKIFASIFNFIAKTIAALFAGLAVLAGILVFLLLGVKHVLLNSETYKRALVENGVYEQLPALVAEQFSLVEEFIADPCKANPLGCSIDGASPELQTCLMDVLGEDAYVEIGSGQRNPTESEVKEAQSCLDQFSRASHPQSESGPPDERPSPSPQSDSDPQPSYLKNLSSENWQALILHLLPPQDLQEMTEATLDQLSAYLNGETDTVTMPLAKLKARLTGQAGEDFIQMMVNAQPPCTEEQKEQINSTDFGMEGQPPVVCAATGETLEKVSQELQSQLNEALAELPKEATLVKPPSASNPASGGGPLGKDPQAALQKINIALNLSPLLPLAFLLLVALFGVRSFKGWLNWWGVPIFITGFILLSIGIAAIPAFEWAWVEFVIPEFPAMFSESNLIPLGHDLAYSVARSFAAWVSLGAACISVAALSALISCRFIKMHPTLP